MNTKLFRLRLKILIVLLVGILSLIVSVAYAGVTFRPNLRVTPLFGYCWSPQVAAYNNNVYVLWSSSQTDTIVFTKSTNKGESFDANTINLSTAGANCGRVMAIDKVGNIYVVFSNGHDIWVRKSVDSGASFDSPVRINSSSAGIRLSPSVAVDTDGNIYIGWNTGYSGDPNNYGIYFSKSTDGGASFSAQVRVDE